MTLTEKLILTADIYCAAVRRSRSRISTIIFGSGDRIDGVARGKDIGTRSYEKAMLWFSANWPEALDWPDGIERPSPVESEAAPAEGAAA